MSDDDDAPQVSSGGGGAPGWIVTFSDLMSLLLAFFVLLFAMSSTDSKKFQLMGGSLAEAFGVQRLMVLEDQVMGINHIASEFSAGRPDMSQLNVIPQDQLLLILRYLTNEPPINAEKESGLGPTESKDDVHGLKKVQEEAEDRYQFDQSGESKEEAHEANKFKDIAEEDRAKDQSQMQKQQQQQEQSQAQSEMKKQAQSESQKTVSEVKTIEKILKEQGKLDNADAQRNDQNISKNMAENESTAKKEVEQIEDAENQVLKKFPKQGDSNKQQLVKLMEGAHQLREKLAEEVQNGFIDIETEGSKLIIRINENGSFTSGQAEISKDALPIIQDISNTLKEVEGDIVIAGHTDNIPTVGGPFKSNWDLSSARAVSMVDELIKTGNLAKRKFKVEAYADTKPRETNKTVAGRARNRRVEIIVEQEAQKIDKVQNKVKKKKDEINHADAEEQRMQEQLDSIFGGLPSIIE